MDFLGFTIDWEHHDAGTPGTTVFVPMTGIRAWQQVLAAQAYGHARPKVVDVPWGQRMEIADPFGNRLRFCEMGDD